MEPGEFLLVSMLEYTHVPIGLASMFLLKSSRAREGFGHSFAGWIDPAWNGILTMELKNYNQVRPLPLYPGMSIGQLIYMAVNESGTYAGRYQHAIGVEASKPEIAYDAGKDSYGN